MTSPRCPKCESRMEEGFVLDQSHAASLQAAWIEGKPQRSFWTGLKVTKDIRHPITTYRCERCGYLESYARDK